jgi:hypothetical protein
MVPGFFGRLLPPKNPVFFSAFERENRASPAEKPPNRPEFFNICFTVMQEGERIVKIGID